MLYGIHQTMLYVILENDLTGIVDRGLYRSQLDQHIGAVLTIFYHSLDRLKMSDGTGEAIDHSSGLGMGMLVRMWMRIIVCMIVIVHRLGRVRMIVIMSCLSSVCMIVNI